MLTMDRYKRITKVYRMAETLLNKVGGDTKRFTNALQKAGISRTWATPEFIDFWVPNLDFTLTLLTDDCENRLSCTIEVFKNECTAHTIEI